MSIRSDIARPFNILMLLIAVGGIILGAYFFLESKREQRPTYLISDEISKIYDSRKTSPNLVLLNASNEKIENDVFLVTAYFWNSGNLPIEPEHIRKSVKFTISNCEKIVDYDVISQTNPDIIDFSLSPEIDRKSLTLNWAHLDPKNGAKFQVFYTGSPNPECLFTGNILGNETFVDGRSRQRTVLGKIIQVAILALLGVFGGLLGFLWGYGWSAFKKTRFVRILIAVSGCLAFLLFYYHILLRGARIPPV